MIVPRMLLKAAGFCKKAKYAKKNFNSYFKFFVSPCFKKANFLFLRWCPKNKSQRDEKFLQLFGKKRRTRTLFSNFSCSKKILFLLCSSPFWIWQVMSNFRRRKIGLILLSKRCHKCSSELLSQWELTDVPHAVVSIRIKLLSNFLVSTGHGSNVL